MGNAATAPSDPSKRVEWMWNANADSLENTELADWRPYPDVENMIIEEAFKANKTHAMLDEYNIDFKQNLQISNNDTNERRSLKRVLCNISEKRPREERFTSNPVAPEEKFTSNPVASGEKFTSNPVALNSPYNGQYGFISIFIKEVVKDLNLTKKQLPSKNPKIIPTIVEKAALGIIEEGKSIRQQRVAEQLANKLTEKKNAGMKEVWKRCANLYSWDSFLYKILNETMRLIGDKEHEQVWRSKIHTLGPYCLLLWDNPFDSEMAKSGTILYRGCKLENKFITIFKDDCDRHTRPWHSFQGFTSCSRKRSVAENFPETNVLFIMTVRLAFIADISKYSEFPKEEEELLFPGVSFTVNEMEFDENKSKHLIYLTLQQRHNSKSI
jgi:hypothetical protein